MLEPEIPFVDGGDGYPTAESVRQALIMFKLGKLANAPANFQGQQGTTVELLRQCKIENLLTNWPVDFIEGVIGAVSQAGQ